MAKLYRIKPVDKKSIYAVYDVYKTDEDGNIRGFVVRELYRWGQGFRELDEPVYAENVAIIVNPNLGWGCELDDTVSIDFEYDGEWTDEEKEELEKVWCDGDPEDPDGRCGAAWLYDYSDWEVEDDYVEILGPFQVDIVDEDEYNVIIEENIKLENRPKLDPNSSWPFK
jgi:hypothetical protein